MLRQILAFLALLTGLGALGTPAQAASDSSFGINVEQRADQNDTDGVQSACVDGQRKQKLRSKKLALYKRMRPATIYIPTVMFGADRAFE